ncbi:MAG: hypothetical protein ABTS16_01720 [Candidatus Accumulibacter phosphatis]|jgi:hypothetical protein|uniref:hypothetical protein n=1 Tax=Candidatus Accumulibacter contiguus TaxID=2954381 RepID=UPI002FC34C2F
MDHRVLFLRTLQDIEERSKSLDPYVILGVSALVRKLFLEKHSLVDSVNQHYRQKLKFRVGAGLAPDANSFPPGSFWSQQDSLDPETSPPGIPTLELGRKEFFQHVVVVTSGHAHTLKEVIRYVAHVSGGVHLGTPENIKEQALHSIDQLFLVGGHSMAIRQLLAVSRVIVKTLEPLKLAVASDLKI